MKTKIPFLDLARIHEPLKAQLEEAFSETLQSNSFILGKKLEMFEHAFADYCGTKHCSGTGNGLDAIYISLRALGIGKGDEVIIPSHTYIATALAVTYCGATPVFVEPNETTFNIDPGRIEAAIKERTKAIIPVHIYGQACEMTAILSIADKHGLKIIEDNAQSQGATWNGRKTGSFGDLAATSFYPGKNIGALGDGGAITTNNDSYFHAVNRIRNYGSEKKYFNEEAGVNSRLDELQAAFLNVKLKYLDEWNAKRQQIADRYTALLKDTGDLLLPTVAPGATSVYHLYVIRSAHRDKLAQFLSSENIGTVIHYPIPIHLQKAYAYLNLQKGTFPIAEKIAETCLSLPLFPGMEDEEIGFVANRIQRFFSNV